MRELMNNPPKGVKLKSVDHPGFIFDGVKHNSFDHRKAIISKPNKNTDTIYAYYGHIPRLTEYPNPSRIACLTAFSEVEAMNIVRKLNDKLESE